MNKCYGCVNYNAKWHYCYCGFCGIEKVKQCDNGRYLNNKMEGVKMTVKEMCRKSDIIMDTVKSDNYAEQGDYLMPELLAMKRLFDNLSTEYNNLLDKWSKYEEYGGF